METMKKSCELGTRWGVILSMPLFLSAVLSAAWGQTRTGWQMNDGEGVIDFGFTASQHGETNEYALAKIPPANDSGWIPAPNADTIGFSRPSTLCGRSPDCMTAGDFTYFQTFVNIPSNVLVTTFTISFDGIDDGVRVTVFNSNHTNGVVVEGSYVFLGGDGTADLADLVKAGETNRVVVTHVDDCCDSSDLNTAQVVLNGDAVTPPLPVTLSIYSRVGMAVEIDWPSQTNKTYLVQYAISLATNIWSDLGTPLEGNGSTNYILDSILSQPKRFYRVLTLP
jgi:hypothetical protein